MNTGWGDDTGFDYLVSSNGSDGKFQRNFVFHVEKDSSARALIVGVDYNHGYSPSGAIDRPGNPFFTVADSGWYTFEHVFYAKDGRLAADMMILDSNGNLLFTQTLSYADDVMSEVGGNRAGYLAFQNVAGDLALDNTSLTVTPIPGAVWLLGSGLVGLVGLRRRNKK